MTETLTVRTASQELADDHRRLHGLIDGLGTAADPAALAEALGELHGALVRHFNEEEKPGGLYDALGVCSPRFRQRLAVLVDEHFRLAGFVRDLRERMKAKEERGGNELRAEVAQLVSALAAHEKREHEMVQEAIAREG
jgi:hypothetical protein